MSVRLTIDGREVEVDPGQSVLDAARKLGIDIPTLCYLERCGPLTTCLVCLVKVVTGPTSRLLPACGLHAQPGMVIESEIPEVHDARRTALELLFSDHVGDCLSPCHRICPLQLNIPVMLRQVDEDRLAEAAATVRSAIPFPTITGRLCHRPCENGCRRGTHDQPAAIREVECFVADHDLQSAQPYLPPPRPLPHSHSHSPSQPPPQKSVAVVGAGPTGLATAAFLLRDGHRVTVFDRHPTPGGTLRRELAAGTLPPEIFEREIALLRQLGAAFQFETELGRNLTLDHLLHHHDAVLLALGESARAQAAHLGIAITPTGLRVDPHSPQTSIPRVFAAGSAVRPIKPIVRAFSEGRTAAVALHQCLLGNTPRPPAKPFSSIMGRLEPAELKLFLNGPSPAPRYNPVQGALRGFSSSEATSESRRCLHCDCRASGNCQLEHYAQLYAVEPNRFRSQRRPFEQYVQHGEIIFEPGKCILCGICIKIAETAREPLGLTFVGRGFDVRLAVPLNRTLAEGLQKVGRECVEACPTGALAFKDEIARFEAAAKPGCGQGCHSHAP